MSGIGEVILFSGEPPVRFHTHSVLYLSLTVSLSQTSADRTQNQPLLVPQAVHVRGQIVGDDGNPIPKVRLYHLSAENRSDDVVTDTNGQFAFETTSPSFVAQRPGFESALIQTSDSPLRLVLHKSPRGPSFPVCSDPKLSDRAPGWRGVFQVPRAQIIGADNEILNVDYLHRTIRVVSKEKVIELEQGRGPMWGGGDPSDESVWLSVRYSEATYDLDGRLLTDAKGWMADGKCWRTVGVLSESASYRDIDCELARPLDDLLDGMCVLPDASKRLFP